MARELAGRLARTGDAQRFRAALLRSVEAGNLTLARRSLRVVTTAVNPADAPPRPPPKPAVGPDDAPSKTWFEVKILDVYGDPVAGAQVTFTQGNKKEKLDTNGNGVVRWKDVEGSSFASAALSKLDALRDSLKSIWGKKKAKENLEGQQLSILDPELAVSLVGEQPTIIVLYKPLTRVRLTGMHFDTNKCFLRPSAMTGIKRVAAVYKSNPVGKLLVAGHTSTSGEENYNLDLSLERAESVRAYLKDDVAAWEAWFEPSKPAQKRWGEGEVASMISALPCEQTVKGFQSWSNETRATDLAVDGAAGPKTRKALVEAYMAIDGTTLPDAITAVTHGCGEFFPMADEGDEGGKDGVDADEDRRVELFCFAEEIEPPVPGPKATRGEPEYPQWVEQVTRDIKVDVASTAFVLTIVDDAGSPMAGADVRVLQFGAEVFSGKTDPTGEITVSGHDESAPCDVMVDGFAVMTLAGGPDEEPVGEEAEALDDPAAAPPPGGSKSFVPKAGGADGAPDDDDPDDDDECGAEFQMEPFVGSATQHTVTAGETMSSIGAPFGLSGKELGEFRGEDPTGKKNVERLKSGDVNKIEVGEVIMVPAADPDEEED